MINEIEAILWLGGPISPDSLKQCMKHKNLGHETFSYQIHKNGVVRIFWEGRCVMTLGGKRGQKLATDLEDAEAEDVQYLLQRVTGNFKRGNER